MAERKLPFDRVMVGQGENTQDLTAEAFLSIPLKTRIRYILLAEIEFYRNGEMLECGAMLRALREYNATR